MMAARGHDVRQGATKQHGGNIQTNEWALHRLILYRFNIATLRLITASKKCFPLLETQADQTPGHLGEG